jgi:hypothetical protein
MRRGGLSRSRFANLRAALDADRRSAGIGAAKDSPRPRARSPSSARQRGFLHGLADGALHAGGRSEPRRWPGERCRGCACRRSSHQLGELRNLAGHSPRRTVTGATSPRMQRSAERPQQRSGHRGGRARTRSNAAPLLGFGHRLVIGCSSPRELGAPVLDWGRRTSGEEVDEFLNLPRARPPATQREHGAALDAVAGVREVTG